MSLAQGDRSLSEPSPLGAVRVAGWWARAQELTDAQCLLALEAQPFGDHKGPGGHDRCTVRDYKFGLEHLKMGGQLINSVGGAYSASKRRKTQAVRGEVVEGLAVCI